MRRFILSISLLLATGCVKTGYNPSFIILDRGETVLDAVEDTPDEEPQAEVVVVEASGLNEAT